MRRTLQILFPSVLLMLVLAGCGVPYAEVGSGGGHSTRIISNNQFEVTYLSNQAGGQPSNRMRELTLLRASEVALEYGFTHFVVEDELEDAQTQWKMRSTTTPIGGMGTSTGGIGIGGSTGGVGIGSSPGGIGIGSSGIGSTGTMSSRGGMVSSSTPVPVSIPELTLKIRCYNGVPSTAIQGQMYDAARLREILAMQYNIDISDEKPSARTPPKIQVIE